MCIVFPIYQIPILIIIKVEAETNIVVPANTSVDFNLFAYGYINGKYDSFGYEIYLFY
jgi:hypothetical protein